MDSNQTGADFLFAEMLRTWTPPDQATIARFERKAVALRNASSLAHLALVPAGLLVFVPLFTHAMRSKPKPIQVTAVRARIPARLASKSSTSTPFWMSSCAQRLSGPERRHHIHRKTV